MKSENTGIDTSEVEILNVSPHGFWLMVGNREYFLGYSDFPWFLGARSISYSTLSFITVITSTGLIWTWTWIWIGLLTRKNIHCWLRPGKYEVQYFATL